MITEKTTKATRNSHLIYFLFMVYYLSLQFSAPFKIKTLFFISEIVER